VCQTCGRGFNKKDHLENHLNKKNPCSPPCIPIITEKIPTSEPPAIPSQTITKNAMYSCNSCDKSFSRQDNLKRHTDFYCKVTKQSDDKDEKIQKLIEENEMLKAIILKNKDEKIQKLIEENEMMKAIISNNKDALTFDNIKVSVNISIP